MAVRVVSVEKYHMNKAKKFSFDRSILAVFLLCVVNIVIRLPFAALPAYEDEINYFRGVAAIAQNHLNPFVEYWGYKPPGMMELPSALINIFGPSLVWGRIEMFFFSSLALYFLYKLGKKVFPSRLTVFLPFLLFFYPLFTAQSNYFSDAMPFTALVLMTLYFYASENLRWYVLSASLLVLTKETGTFLPAAIFLFDVVMSWRPPISFQKPLMIRWIALLLPEFVFLVWIAVNKILFGWYLWPFNLGVFHPSMIFRSLYSTDFVWYFYNFFVRDFSWIVFALAFSGTVHLAASRSAFGKKKVSFIYFFSSVIFLCWFVSFIGPYQDRYLLFLFPLGLLVFVATLPLFVSRFRQQIAIVVIVCFGFVVSNLYRSLQTPNPWNNQSSFGYFRAIMAQKRAISALSVDFPEAGFVVTDQTHFSHYFTDPLLGYIKKPFPLITASCDRVSVSLLHDDFIRSFSFRPNELLYIAGPYQSVCPTLARQEPVWKDCADAYPYTDDCFKVYSITTP